MTDATRSGTMPQFAPERFVALVERYLAELDSPWHSHASREEVTEREVAHGGDAHATRTTRNASHGGRTMNVEQTVWQELDSNGTSTKVHTVGTLFGLAGGVVLTVEGERDLETWRVSGGTSADVDATAASWIRFCDAVFRAGHEWYEHPAIPSDWMRLAKGLDVLGETRAWYASALESGYLLFHPTRTLAREGASWLFHGTLSLDEKRVPMRLLGPFPAKCPLSCVLSGEAADGVGVTSMDAERVAHAMLGGEATWTLEHEATRSILQGGTYFFVDLQRAGQTARGRPRTLSHLAERRLDHADVAGALRRARQRLRAHDPERARRTRGARLGRPREGEAPRILATDVRAHAPPARPRRRRCYPSSDRRGARGVLARGGLDIVRVLGAGRARRRRRTGVRGSLPPCTAAAR